MTPKQKAEELVRKFEPIVVYWDCYNDAPMPTEDILVDAKQCAIIAVDEILDECTYWAGGINIDWENDRFKFWQEVKHEIKKV